MFGATKIMISIVSIGVQILHSADFRLKLLSEKFNTKPNTIIWLESFWQSYVQKTVFNLGFSIFPNFFSSKEL